MGGSRVRGEPPASYVQDTYIERDINSIISHKFKTIRYFQNK